MVSDQDNTGQSQDDTDQNSAELTAAETAKLNALLSNPNLWDEPDPGIEDLLVTAISEELANPVTGAIDGEEPAFPNDSAKVVSIFSRSRSRITRSAAPFLSGVAAALLLLAGLWVLLPGDDGVELALLGTDLAPQAAASALVDQGPLGVRIKLDISGLPPSPEGTYYQAWVRKSPEVGVSAGTFHLRGGDGEIELWAGVSTDDYPLITVTIQQEDEGEASSGKVVLKGRLGGS